MPTYWNDDDDNDYEDYEDDDTEDADDWEGDWDSDFNSDYDDWEDDRDYDDDSEDDDQDDDWDNVDWEDDPEYNFFEDTEDEMDNYLQQFDNGAFQYDVPTLDDQVWENIVNSFNGGSPMTFSDDQIQAAIQGFQDSGIWDLNAATQAGADISRFEADPGDIMNAPDPNAIDWSVFESPAAQEWIKEFQELNPLASADEVANAAAQAYIEAMNVTAPQQIISDTTVPDLSFDPGALPAEFSEFGNPETSPDSTVNNVAAAALAEMPEFAGMPVDEIAAKLSEDPNAVENILASADPEINRQTGDPVNPEGEQQNALEKIAFGDASEMVTPQSEKLPEAIMNGDTAAVGNFVDQMVDQAMSESTPTQDMLDPTQNQAAVVLPPDEVPGSQFMPTNTQGADGSSQQEITGPSGDTYIRREDGTLLVRDAQTGEERQLYGKEDYQVRQLFEGPDPDMDAFYKAYEAGTDPMYQKTLGSGEDTPTAPGSVVNPATGEIVQFRTSADAIAAGQENFRAIQQINAELANIGKQPIPLEGGTPEQFAAYQAAQARKAELTQALKDRQAYQVDISRELDTLAKGEIGSKTNGRAGNTISFEDAGGKYTYNEETGKMVMVSTAKAGWLINENENGQKEIIQNIYMTPGGSFYTTARVIGEDGKGKTEYYAIDIKPGDRFHVMGQNGVTRIDPYETTTDATARRAQEARDSQNAALAARQAAARSASASRPSSGGSRASGGASKSAEMQKQIADDQLAQRMKEHEDTMSLQRDTLAQRALEHSETIAAQFAKMSQDDNQFMQNLDMVKQQLQQKIDDSMAQRAQFAQNHDLQQSELANRKAEFAQNLQTELTKIQNNTDQFMMNYNANQKNLDEVIRANQAKEQQARDELKLAQEKHREQQDRPEIVNLGGGQYLQFDKTLNEWVVKGGGGFSGSRSRGGSI